MFNPVPCCAVQYWADGHLQVIEQEKKLVLTGEISKALGGISGRVSSVDAMARNMRVSLLLMQHARCPQQLGVAVGRLRRRKRSPTGTAFIMSVEWKDGDASDNWKKVRSEELVFNVKTQKPLQQVAWIYSGSRIVPDLDSDDEDAMMPQAFMSNDTLRVFDAARFSRTAS